MTAFIGRFKGVPKKRAFYHKMKVLALVDRDSGKARTILVDDVKAETLMPLVIANVAHEARLMMDELSGYRKLASGSPLAAPPVTVAASSLANIGFRD